jgi:hypothetical protein
MSLGDMLIDDSAKAKTADEAVEKARKLAGICSSLINDDICQKIRELEAGETLKVKRPSLKFTLHVRRTVR